MSDELQPQDFQKQLQRLERRYQRELRARKEAEEILEDKSRELYEQNKKLQKLSEDADILVKKRTKELVIARDEALKAADSKSEFLANMSHELRTPMNGILGMMKILAKTSLDLQQEHYLRIAQNSGELLLSVINDVLDFSKINANKMTFEFVPFSPKALLEETLEPLLFSAREQRNKLTSHCDNEIPPQIIGDITRLKQIITNLVSNAVKFTENGKVSVSILNNNSSYRIEVSDSGIGMSNEQLNRIFEAFNQADTSITRTHGGTGLGLAITNQLVQLMDGTITVTSETNQGTTFAIELPLKVPENTSETESHEAQEVVFKGQRVLLVEDNVINQEVAEFLLEDMGLTITIANNGAEAIAELDKASPEDPIHVVFMDLQMPVMDGLEASRRIRNATNKNYCNIPIIAMTAHASQEHRDECKAVGMNDHLTKPIETLPVNKALQRWLEADTTEHPAESPEQPQVETPSTEPGAPPAKLMGVNLDEALARVKGNWPLLKKLLISLVKDQGDAPALIGQTLEQNQLDKAAKISHTLKGSAANVGAMTLAQAAAAIESAIKESQPELALEKLPLLEREMDTLKTSVDTLKSESKKNGKALSTEELKKFIAPLKILLDSDLPKAETILSSLMDCHLAEEQNNTLTHIQNAVEIFDIETAQHHLRALANSLANSSEHKQTEAQ